MLLTGRIGAGGSISASSSYAPTDLCRLITNYHILHDGVHARSGQSAPLKLMYFRTDQEAYLAWVSQFC